MFEIPSEEKIQIDGMHSVKKDVEKQLSEENKRVYEEWKSFVNLTKSYMSYIRIIRQDVITTYDKDLNVIIYGTNLILAIDYNKDNYYIIKKQSKKLFKKQKYQGIAVIETWGNDKILFLNFDYNYITEIEQLYQELKQAYKEKVENEIQNKTVELETLKLVYPSFN